jgi:hypothetical protein
LGTHDNREKDKSKQEDDLVLVIRGELLKKYPNAVIYALKAVWQKNKDGTMTRDLITLTDDDMEILAGNKKDKSEKANVKLSLYDAQVQPDIYFLGFDLTNKDQTT